MLSGEIALKNNHYYYFVFRMNSSVEVEFVYNDVDSYGSEMSGIVFSPSMPCAFSAILLRIFVFLILSFLVT